MDEWINKMWYVYTYNGITFSLKKERIDTITWMNFEEIMLSKISQLQKDNYCMIPLIRDT